MAFVLALIYFLLCITNLIYQDLRKIHFYRRRFELLT